MTMSDNLNQTFHLTYNNNFVNDDALFSDSKVYYCIFQKITDQLSINPLDAK